MTFLASKVGNSVTSRNTAAGVAHHALSLSLSKAYTEWLRPVNLNVAL